MFWARQHPANVLLGGHSLTVAGHFAALRRHPHCRAGAPGFVRLGSGLAVQQRQNLFPMARQPGRRLKATREPAAGRRGGTACREEVVRGKEAVGWEEAKG
eukprot:GGOE01057764.1.p1 GENE.GGOE01057764.1~~GGOE01057764.1.p1  ORF type:complete len:101 (+),score=2.82 GGOE01057764.1:65-367(+)